MEVHATRRARTWLAVRLSTMRPRASVPVEPASKHATRLSRWGGVGWGACCTSAHCPAAQGTGALSAPAPWPGWHAAPAYTRRLQVAYFACLHTWDSPCAVAPTGGAKNKRALIVGVSYR